MLDMWKEKDKALYKKFEFKDFKQAFAFMQSVAAEAEKLQHHPRWQNEWNVVEIWLSTHEAGSAITDKDRALAKAVDVIFSHQNEVESMPALESKEIKMFADGGSRGNPGPSASGYVLLDMHDKVIARNGTFLGETTNNQAEYHSLKSGLEDAYNRGAEYVHVYMDSQLVINQMKGSYKVRHAGLKPVYQEILGIAAKFEDVSYTHVPRELNKAADAMVNKVLDSQ
jgi:ribonuclease HI/pterin-4a-carbinolamine dehydratase